MHEEQRQFCLSVKNKFPDKFKDCSVLDVGSMDINGNNRYLFSGNYKYHGIDIGEGKNVDEVVFAHVFNPQGTYDIVISTEMLEHDKYFSQSLSNMMKIVRPGGLLIITCAGIGRAEHGTKRTTPENSPFTTDYYENVSARMITTALHLEAFFFPFCIEYGGACDLYFYGVKRF